MNSKSFTLFSISMLLALFYTPVFSDTTKIDSDLNIHIPYSEFTTADGQKLGISAGLDFTGINARGNFSWEAKPGAYSIVDLQASPSEACNIADESTVIIDCPAVIPKGVTITLQDRNGGVDYIVNCVVQNNGNLIIEPGVNIQFANDTGITVENDGVLKAVGTIAQPITFSAEEKTPGHWRGLFFNSNADNIIQNAIIEYAGGQQWNSNADLGAVIVWSGAKLTLNNTTLRNNASYGIIARYLNSSLELVENTITHNAMPMILRANYASTISGGVFLGNTTDAIEILGETLINQHVWSNHKIPYRILEKVRVNKEGILTIQPGVVLEFDENGSLEIIKQEGLSGSLIAIGTPEEPIVFTAVNRVTGAWKGLTIDGDSELNEIGFAIIAHASNEDQKGAILMRNAPPLNVHHVTFSDIEECALFASPDLAHTNPNPKLISADLIFDNVTDSFCGGAE